MYLPSPYMRWYWYSLDQGHSSQRAIERSSEEENETEECKYSLQFCASIWIWTTSGISRHHSLRRYWYDEQHDRPGEGYHQEGLFSIIYLGVDGSNIVRRHWDGILSKIFLQARSLWWVHLCIFLVLSVSKGLLLPDAIWYLPFSNSFGFVSWFTGVTGHRYWQFHQRSKSWQS